MVWKQTGAAPAPCPNWRHETTLVRRQILRADRGLAAAHSIQPAACWPAGGACLRCRLVLPPADNPYRVQAGWEASDAETRPGLPPADLAIPPDRLAGAARNATAGRGQAREINTAYDRIKDLREHEHAQQPTEATAPSILSANFARLGEEVDNVLTAGGLGCIST